MTRKARHQIQQKSFKNLMFETNLMREESFLTDVTLQCQDKEFFVHKLILSAASPYFKEYFRRNSNTLQALRIDFINSKTLETVLMFIYEGRINVTKESKELLKDLVEASKTLQIPLLYNYCLQLILDCDSIEQFLTKWNTIEELNSAVLKQIYLEELHKNIGILQSTENFLYLSFRQISSLLNCTIFNPVNQEGILTGILLWVKYNQIDRRNLITDLLKSIDFEKISISCLQKYLNDPLLQGNLYFNQNVAKALSDHLSSKECHKLPRCNSAPSKKKIEAKTSYLAKIKNSLKTIPMPSTRTEAIIQQKTCEEKQTHKEKEPEKQDSLKKTATEEINTPSKRIFCYDYWKTGEILEYNLNSKTWMAVRDELLVNSFTKAQSAAICNVNSSVYFFGGVNDKGKTTNRCFFLDLIKRKCFEINPMTEPRKNAKAVRLNDFVYVIGGENEKLGYIRANERFNLNTRMWERVSEIPFPYKENNIQVDTVGNCLCLVGECCLLWYDPQSNQWRKGRELPKESSGDTKAIIHENGLIFIVNETINNILTFDLNTRSWDYFGIPGDLVHCSDIIPLSEPNNLDFLVVRDFKSFHYKQAYTVIKSNCKPRPIFKIRNSVNIPFEFPKLIAISK